jgi:hypothetical protein
VTDEAPKKAWARCPACSTVYPNIQIAKDGHKLNCPHDMKLRIDKQDRTIADLEQKVLALGGNLDEITSEPGLDFTGVEDDEAPDGSIYMDPQSSVADLDDDDYEDEDLPAVR